MVTSGTPHSPYTGSGRSRRRSSRFLVKHDPSKTCSSCGAKVARQDCHKNRFGEYICRNCQAAGVVATRQTRAMAWVKRLLRRSAWGLVGTVIVLSVLALLLLFSQ